MKRAIVIVIDALGIGALPDAAEFGDGPDCCTLGNVARSNGGLHLPVLGSLGLGCIIPVDGVPPADHPLASFGRMQEQSRGKDTTTGHWELSGLVLATPFTTYPDGFSDAIIAEFMKRTGVGGVLGNRPASGTEIIETCDAEHTRTGWPIVYTSADSVFQIATNTATVPLDQLYAWCTTARQLLDETASVSRVIARPYQRNDQGQLTRMGGDRRDYAVPPPAATVLDAIAAAGGRTIAIGKIEDIFCGRGITHSIHTKGNTHGLAVTHQALRGELSSPELTTVDASRCLPDRGDFIFVNLVDTDSLYGHRRDPAGYGRALEEIDSALGQMLPDLGEDDLLIITGDHGCDPTAPGTDHTREYVPLLVYRKGAPAEALGTLPSFTAVAERVAQWLGVPFSTP